MAKKCESKNVESKGSNSIYVDILHDGEGFILVSYNHGPKKFQGVLMEVNRSGVPSGVRPPAWFDAVQPGTDARSPDPNDPYHTISTRMTYFQTSYDLSAARKDAGGGAPAPQPAAKRRHHHHKGGRSTVRLRPRQVLCSNCKSMCTESLQSVQPAGRRRKDGDENVDPAAAPVAAGTAQPLPPAPVAEPRPLVQPPAPALPPPPSERLPPPPPLKVPRIPIVRLSAHQLRRSSSCAGDGDTGDVGGMGSCSGSSSSTTTSLSSSASSSPTPPTTPTLTKLTVSPIKIVGNNVKKCDPTSSKPKLQKIKISGGAIVPPPKAAAATAGAAAAADGDVARRTGLRKKRLAVGSMEDLWDESVLDDGNRTASSEQEEGTSLTPVLKISFGGREGAGTVLKIPAKYKLQAGEQETERPAVSTSTGVTATSLHPSAPTASAKAAKRALKKARKDVQRKLVGSPRASPAYHPWGSPRASPAYTRLSPSYPQMSPAYYRVASAALGLSPAHPSLSPAHPSLSPVHPSLSPAHPGPAPAPAPAAATAPAAAAGPAPAPGSLRKKRHKHKLKHKRRRRERGDREEASGALSTEVQMKERCLSQKLSISLRRIRASEYAADATSDPSTSAPSAGGGSGVPPFPETRSPPADTSVSSCQLPDGRRLSLNDVIWGKVHGFPWWPGKVMCINDGGPAFQEAYVSWYGSTTSSLMPCSQLLPFLDTFESRVNRKRRGPYREAVRQATLEAERALPAAAAPAPSSAAAQGPAQSPSQPPLALAGSPPEVDVAS
ncbi:PWWP domain-containing protein 2B-like isoform X2 [Amphibalanus amphitrite]|uniref:PWWP domain-containing protein 2B-like isoform X2 n=1 Tax=Amphibalanus amphitrite TaxID=1232801 RepID=UPI001C92A027|nr:PWWP domain-containing protein 2B-like isoform X2 [Amphibalanus amphitrite]